MRSGGVGFARVGQSRFRDAIGQPMYALHLGAVGTAENDAVFLDPVTNYLASAVLTNGGHSVYGTLEGIEDVHLPADRDGEGFVVVVAADVAFSHGKISLERDGRTKRMG